MITTSISNVSVIGARQDGSPIPVGSGRSDLQDPKSLQRFLDNASAGTQLKFRVDSDINRVIVQVLDSQSGETLRQIPREEALLLAREAQEQRAKANEAQQAAQSIEQRQRAVEREAFISAVQEQQDARQRTQEQSATNGAEFGRPTIDARQTVTQETARPAETRTTSSIKTENDGTNRENRRAVNNYEQVQILPNNQERGQLDAVA